MTTATSDIKAGPLGNPRLSRDGRTMVVSIPIQLNRKAGRKQVVTPAGSSSWQSSTRVDTTIVKALVRAHRWRTMLESGKFDSVRELAKAEKINESYLGRTLRLTLLSPELTGAILDGRHPEGLSLEQLLKGMPTVWKEQSASLAKFTAS
jgi:hypothetical protein